MELNERELEQALGVALGAPVLVSVASEPLPVAALTPAEREQFGPLATTPRRESWLLGRAALKQVLLRLGQPLDTALLAFPHRNLSLTHSGGVAVALAVEPVELDGLGVDLEGLRTPPVQVARLFLAPAEEDWLRQQSPAQQPAELLRLWTIKEALFKADPHNGNTGLADYYLPDPQASSGTALALSSPALTMRYASIPVTGGVISTALAITAEAR